MADLAFAELAQLLFGELLAFLGHDDRQQLFAKEFVGNADNLHISDFGMANQELFNLAREDIFAAAYHHVFEAANDVDIALRVHGRKVARMQPAITINGVGGLLRHVVIARHHQVTPAAQFATFSTWYNLTRGRVDNLDLTMRHRHPNGG